MREVEGFPEKKYSIIYADPPWSYPKTGGKRSSRGMAKQHYQTMPIQDICGLPVREISAENCALFLWATFPQIIPVKEAIEEWEPRAEYKDINLFFDPSNPGKLAFTVQIEIKAGDSA